MRYVELSSAFETQGEEFEALRFKVAEVEKQASTAAAAERSPMESAQQVVALTDEVHAASARAHIGVRGATERPTHLSLFPLKYSHHLRMRLKFSQLARAGEI